MRWSCGYTAMPGVQTTLRMVRSRSWWRTPILPSRGVPSAASTSEGLATARSTISLTATSGVECPSAARQSATNWSRFSMGSSFVRRWHCADAPVQCIVGGLSYAPRLRASHRAAAHHPASAVAPGQGDGGAPMKRRTKLGTLSCVLLVAACSAPATTRNAGVPEAGPRFASGGPDAEAYGASPGYPKGERGTFLRVGSLVGSHTHL